MAGFSQENRPLRVQLGSLDRDAVIITAFSGTETLSRLYRFTLDVVAPADAPLKFEDVLGQPAAVSIDQQTGPVRFVHGIVNRMSQTGRDNLFAFYRLELAPKLWLLTKQLRTRTFQHKTVKEILEEVIGPLYSPRFSLEADYFPRNYCVQYRESDFAFISRVMEEEGMHYYFTHTKDGQELVISDNPRGHDPLPDDPVLLFHDSAINPPLDGRVTRWEKAQELRTTAISLTDRTFEMPTNDLGMLSLGVDTVKAGTVDHPTTVGEMDKATVEDHPGGYARWRDGVAPGGAERSKDLEHVFSDNGRISVVEVEREMAGALEVQAQSTYTRVTTGHQFTFQDHFDADGEYVVTAADHAAKCGVGESGEVDSFSYSNRFTCIPAVVPFRPARTTPRPFIRGTQTAVVVGSGEEIEPDKYGRVKVQFYWDRLGKHDLDSSCWVRVAQSWAGRQWGTFFLPRVGDEVVVTFLEGDPDQPLIVGSVYNADNMPIYTQDKNKTQTGIKTHSSPGGGESNFNELRFEDKKGQEQIVIHAEKDMNTTVENNRSLFVGNNSTVTIGEGGDKADPKKNGTSTTTIFGDTKVTITKGDFNFDVQTGTSTTHVKGEVTENYDTKQTTTVVGNQFTKVTEGHHLVKVSKGHASLHVDAGNRYVNVGAGFYDVIAATKITLTVGSSSLEMLADGTITLKGVNIVIDGSTSVTVKGGGAETGWASSTITEKGPTAVNVTGGTINLNS